MSTEYGNTFAISEEECRDAVMDALDSLPDQFASVIANCAVIIEDEGPPGVMGLYEGPSSQSGLFRRTAPSTITIYRKLHRTREQVRDTVLHEFGHYFGMEEAQLEELGL